MFSYLTQGFCGFCLIASGAPLMGSLCLIAAGVVGFLAMAEMDDEDDADDME